MLHHSQRNSAPLAIAYYGGGRCGPASATSPVALRKSALQTCGESPRPAAVGAEVGTRGRRSVPVQQPPASTHALASSLPRSGACACNPAGKVTLAGRLAGQVMGVTLGETATGEVPPDAASNREYVALGGHKKGHQGQ